MINHVASKGGGILVIFTFTFDLVYGDICIGEPREAPTTREMFMPAGPTLKQKSDSSAARK